MKLLSLVMMRVLSRWYVIAGVEMVRGLVSVLFWAALEAKVSQEFWRAAGDAGGG